METPPKPLQLDGKDRLLIREGGGCMSVFGLPFLGAGIFMLLAGLKVIPFQNAEEINFGMYAMLFGMGSVFTCVGGWLVFGRRLTVIDRARSLVLDEWRVFVPVKRKEARARDFREVILNFERGDSDSADTYPVVLEGTESLKLLAPMDFGEARSAALCIAEFLKLPFVDKTTDNVKTYAPGPPEQAGDGTQTAKPELKLVSSSPPSNMKTRITEKNGEVEMFVPQASGIGCMIVLLFVMLFFVSDFISWKKLFHDKLTFDNPGDFIGAGFFSLFFVAAFVLPVFMILRLWLGKHNIGTVVRISKDTLSIEDKTSRRSRRTRSFPFSDILSIEYTVQEDLEKDLKKNPFVKGSSPFQPGYQNQQQTARKIAGLFRKLGLSNNKIILKTKHEIYEFGYGLSKEEIMYLCGYIEKRVKGITV